jgi:TPR repeat protein
MWREGDGGAVDLKRARALFSKACELSNGQSCANLAAMGLATEGGDKDEAGARASFRKACGLGVAAACHIHGTMCAAGTGGPADPAAAFRGFYTACQAGIERGCAALNSLDIDPRALNRDACRSGDAHACFFSGQMADEGIKGPRDAALARVLYFRACKAKIPSACNNLAEMWAKGIGGERHLGKARWYFKLACDNNGAKGCANLAILAAWEGDLKKGRALRSKACLMDHAESCARLAWYWSWGWGGPRDLLKAAVFDEMACDKGHEASCERGEENAS